MRSFLSGLLRLCLRLFYRRIDVVGADHVPAEAGVIYAANHPNGLVDPLFILCFAPRPVSFLAKAPLFGYPFIGWLVRALDSIPVYRREDRTTGSNEETFARARAVLQRGGSVAIFPEGTTHSDGRLRELKTGAARIALGASLPSLLIVPTAIEYTAKQTFRSSAVVIFGNAIAVNPDADDPQVVEELTRQIGVALAAVALQADSRAAMDLITRAERIFSGGAIAEPAQEIELRRRFIDGYRYLSGRDEARVADLAARVGQLESELRAARLHPDSFAALSRGSLLRSLAIVLFLFPAAILGAAIHYLAYRLVDLLAKRFSKDEDELTATMKFIGALLLFPLTWIVLAAAVEISLGVEAAGVVLVLAPLLGYAALRVVETLDEVIGRARFLLRRMFGQRAFLQIEEQRRRLREDIIAIAAEIERNVPTP